jgi:hypothetical protein
LPNGTLSTKLSPHVSLFPVPIFVVNTILTTFSRVYRKSHLSN